MYAQIYWNQPHETISFRAPTLVGEGYLRGGWTGVVVVLALMGGLTRLVNAAFSTRRFVEATPLFVILWTQITDVEAALIIIVASAIQVLLLTTIAMRWAIIAIDDHASSPRGDRPVVAA